MDAQAHLLSLGWAGPGHSLDSRPNLPGSYKQKGHRGLAYDPSKDPLKVGNTGNGLVKPLFISQRKNRFGVGKKAHEAPAGNEWWLKGFESALGNVGKSESERSSGTSTPMNGPPAGKHGALYEYFIKGQMMQGTIDQDVSDKTSRKRKSSEFEEDNHDKLNLRPTSPKKPATAHEFEMVGAFMRERDKELRRRQKKEKTSDLEQFTQIGEFFGVAEQRPKKKRKSEQPKEVDIVETTIQLADEPEETKEERRERRRRRKEERRATAVDSNGVDGVQEVEDTAAKAARKIERKKRKAEKAARKDR